MYRVNDVKQIEIYTSESLVYASSALEVEMALKMIKRQKSPSINQIPTEFIKAGSRTIRSESHELT